MNGQNQETDSVIASTPMQNVCGRASAKMLIDETIARLTSQAKRLQTIRDMLPEKLTPEQDDALFSTLLFTKFN